MAGGCKITLGSFQFRNAECLYQACRFPHLPDVQLKIAQEPSPMFAKGLARRHQAESREDWNCVRVSVMRWCLRLKLLQHPQTFGKTLLDTGEKPIVEMSPTDDFWGAKPVTATSLIGKNVLGRLLMELRLLHAEILSTAEVKEPEIPNFYIVGKSIKTLLDDKHPFGLF